MDGCPIGVEFTSGASRPSSHHFSREGVDEGVGALFPLDDDDLLLRIGRDQVGQTVERAVFLWLGRWSCNSEEKKKGASGAPPELR